MSLVVSFLVSVFFFGLLELIDTLLFIILALVGSDIYIYISGATGTTGNLKIG